MTRTNSIARDAKSMHLSVHCRGSGLFLQLALQSINPRKITKIKKEAIKPKMRQMSSSPLPKPPDAAR